MDTNIRDELKREVAHRTLATELYDIERNIALFTERSKEIRAKLLSTLKDQGVRRVDLDNGNSYIVYPRNKLVVKDDLAAQKWALENPEARMSLDTTAAIKVALTGKLKWAKVEKQEYLRVSRARGSAEE